VWNHKVGEKADLASDHIHERFFRVFDLRFHVSAAELQASLLGQCQEMSEFVPLGEVASPALVTSAVDH
jgi:hypothetical protein